LTPELRQQKEDLFKQVALNYQEAYGYTNLYLFDATGRLLFRVKSDLNLGDNLLTGPLKGTELSEVFERSRMLLQSEVSDYQVYPGLGEPAVFIANPVLKDGKVVGIVVLQIGNQELYRVFTDYTGLGETGETLVATRKGDDLIFVAPFRNDSEAAFRRRVRMGDDLSTTMQRAVRGERGYGSGIDYRREPVLASWSYLPAFRWGLQVKQDQDEAYAMIDQQRLSSAVLLAVTMASVAWVAWSVARSISRSMLRSRGAPPLETDRCTDTPSRCSLPAAGDWLMTLPAATLSLKASWRVPTVRRSWAIWASAAPLPSPSSMGMAKRGDE